MEFRVLGPLEVVRDGEPVQLREGRQAALLALLLINRNELVTADRIVEELWGSRPPATVAKIVQAYVSRLRRQLDAGGEPSRIETRKPGYLLRVLPGELDLDVFERLLREAEQAIGTGEPDRSETLLGNALSLWRGRPLSEFEYDAFAQAEIARLTELHLRALERRADAWLALGRHAELVPELEQLIAGQPLREQPRSALMLALYRSGRQADALAAYQEARRVLVDELGIEPSPSLRELQEAILRQDPSLQQPAASAGLPAAAAVRDDQPAPRKSNLPALLPLLGREDEQGEIATLLGSGARLLTITGTGGVGKTHLALHAANAQLDRFDGGVFFVELGSLAEASFVSAAVASELSVSPQDLERRLRERPLLVLDNAEHLPGVAEVVSELVGFGAVVLVTSRGRLQLRYEHEYTLGPLADDAAFELFRARAAAAGRRVEVDDDVRAICRRLDNLPLAIELAAARSKHLRLRDLRSQLERSFELLKGGPRDAPERHQTLRAAIDWSYRLLGEDERSLFASLGVFAGGWTLDAAVSVCAGTVDVLANLIDGSLIRPPEDGTGRFAMLETIRAYALEALALDPRREALARAHAAYFLESADAAAARLEGGDQIAALEEIGHDLDNIRAALAWAEANKPAWTAPLVTALGRFWTSRGLYREARTWLEPALDGGEGEKSVGVKALLHAGVYARHDGAYEDARELFKRGLAAARAVESVEAEARFLLQLGQVDFLTGRLGEARTSFERALSLQAEIDPAGASLTRVSLGAVALARQEYELAAMLHETGIGGLRNAGDDISLAYALPGLAYSKLQLGLRDDAGRLWREAAQLARGLQAWEAAAWALLVGSLAEAEEDPRRAADWLSGIEAAYEQRGWTWGPIETRIREEASLATSGPRDLDDRPTSTPPPLETLLDDVAALANASL